MAGSSDIATNLRDNGTKWHKGCAIELSLWKMQRALNRREEGNVNYEMETPSKKTRTSVSAKSPLGNNTCLFCDLSDTLSEEDPLCRTNKLTKEMKCDQLHRVTSFNRDSNIRQVAASLGDTKLLAKLAEGDLITREACYHKKCMTDFTNRYMSYTKPVDKDKQMQMKVESPALAEVMMYIEDRLQSCEDEVAPFVKLSEVRKFYCHCLEQQGAVFKTVNATRLKEDILKLNSNLETNFHEKEIYISYKDD